MPVQTLLGIPDEIAAAIDKARGETPRNTWILGAILKALKRPDLKAAIRKRGRPKKVAE